MARSRHPSGSNVSRNSLAPGDSERRRSASRDNYVNNEDKQGSSSKHHSSSKSITSAGGRSGTGQRMQHEQPAAFIRYKEFEKMHRCTCGHIVYTVDARRGGTMLLLLLEYIKYKLYLRYDHRNVDFFAQNRVNILIMHFQRYISSFLRISSFSTLIVCVCVRMKFSDRLINIARDFQVGRRARTI